MEVAPTIHRSPEHIFTRLWQRINQTGSAQERLRSGRPRITTPAQDRYIGVFHLRNRAVTTTATVTGIPCIQTISDIGRYFSRAMSFSIQQGQPWIASSEQHYCIVMTFRVARFEPHRTFLRRHDRRSRQRQPPLQRLGKLRQEL